MLWEVVLIGADEELNSIPKQFISVNELLGLFADCEKMTLERSAQWLSKNIYILNKSKKLVLKNTYTLIEYEHNDSDFYNCPIKTIRLIASGEDDQFLGDCVGFTRFQLLKDLESIGLNIDRNLILNSRAYISQSCYERDDNFYKNQCINLIRELGELRCTSTQKPQKLSDIHKYALYLNKGNPLYFQGLELLARIHHELNVMNKYSGRSNKDDRIKDFLKDYGAEYGYTNPKPFHIKKISSFIDTIKDQKPTIEILNELGIEKSN